MQIINPHTGSIDVGSKSHFVIMGQTLTTSRNLEYIFQIMKKQFHT
jgi:hypothetical protein